MPPGRERVHRATRSTPAVNGTASDNAARVAASISPGLQPSANSAFGCNQCSKVFNRRENLSRHLKTHDASPSHRCPKCDKAFTRSDLLKRHENGHERWDKKDSTAKSANGSAKRRRVAFEESVIPNKPSSTSPWAQEVAATSSPREIREGLLHRYSTNDTPLGDSEHFAANDRHSRQLLHSNYQSMPATQAFNPQSPDGYRHAQQFGNTDLPDQRHADFDELNPNEYLPFDPFDFSSFLLPPDTGPVGNEWFSHDFYSAMRETGNEWGSLGDLLDPNFLSPGQDDGFTSVSGDEHSLSAPKTVPEPEHPQGATSEEESDDNRPDHGRISRISSPPNEASEEDKWPFQWNPNSRPILKANPILIPSNHPLLQNHNQRFDISETTLLRLGAFLKPPAGREFHQSQKGSFVLPSLPIINIFIGLFFEHFSPQMPIVHHATVNTNADLPPPLLAAMIIIGAIYSHLKHTRRFSIVLLDIVRWNLQIALECDNSLMREPMIIFAEALICHTGLWCGNKRAFELAEVVRGAVVTYIRRVHFQAGATPAAQTSVKDNLNAQWRRWVQEESQRRLYWAIYALDAQFPSLLNLPATIAIGEVSDLGCPCDEEFWCASSARNWKNLLGPATVPPSRSFSAAISPFILSIGSKSVSKGRSVHGHPNRLPVLDLNPWSAFLVLMTIQNQIFQLSQESLLARTFIDEEERFEEDKRGGQQQHDDGQGSAKAASSILRAVQSKHREQLADSLSSWSKAYSSPRSRSASHETSQYFHAASVIIYHLSTILLDIELSDLQNAIGKDGTAGMSQAMSSLRTWARKSPQTAENVAFSAVKTVVSLAPNRNIHEDSGPYSVITLFLCHVILWVFASVSPPSQKQQFLDKIKANGELHSSHFYGVLRSSLSLELNSSGSTKSDEPKVLFKSGAEMLTQLGTWGASLNLALLIHRRAEMQ